MILLGIVTFRFLDLRGVEGLPLMLSAGMPEAVHVPDQEGGISVFLPRGHSE